MSLILIRHGETTGDVEDRYGGAYDDVLSPAGVRQGERLVHDLCDKGIVGITTSTLVRAQQTGTILGVGLGLRPCASDALLNERDSYGPMSGMTKAEAAMKYPEWVTGVKDRMFVVPGGESYSSFRARMEKAVAFYQDLALKEGTQAVVWHGGGKRVLFRDILKLGELTHIDNTCWVELHHEDGMWRVGDSARIGFAF